MMKTKGPLQRVPIAVTVGDPNGIGPEVTARALRRIKTKHAHFLVIGDQPVFEKYFTGRFSGCDFYDAGVLKAKDLRPGKATAAAAAAAWTYLTTAIHLIRQEQISGLITAPVCKDTIAQLGHDFPGHTEILARAAGSAQYEMMFVTPALRTVIVTRHVPIAEVPKLITPEAVYATIRTTAAGLKDLFGIRSPHLAVCGLNPHAGEGGRIGTEDEQQILPAIQQARRARIQVDGPLAADTVFVEKNARRYDAVIAMYHDQGLIPVKAMHFSKAVNLTLGLPFVRTSPAHGTGFDIAGQGQADPSSMQAAIELAVELAQRKKGLKD